MMRIVNFDKVMSKPTKAQLEFIENRCWGVCTTNLTFEEASKIISDEISSWEDDRVMDDLMNPEDFY